MKLSMWIIADWLKGYSPEIHIEQGGLQIETVRLFSSGFSISENCVYVGRMKDLFVQGKEQVICTYKNDILVLKTDDIDEVINQVLNAFDYYKNWNDRVLEAVSSGKRPEEILEIANEVIPEPVFLMDSNQFVIAQSKAYGEGSVNELWDQMLQTGSANIDFLTRLEEEFPAHREKRDLYLFSVPFVEQNSYNYNMFLEDQWIGLCSMIERDGPLPQYIVDLFRIFCLAIERWFLIISREKEIMMIDAMFREALISSDGVSEAFLRQYRLRFRNRGEGKKLLVLDSTVQQPLLISHVCRELNLMFPELLAVIWQNYICVIVNGGEEEQEQTLRELSGVLKRNRYYGGCSRTFTDLREVSRHFHEALYAAVHTDPFPGRLSSFDKFALRYMLGEIAEHMEADVFHPAVRKLAEYDKEHHTEFSRTLQVYLENERSQSKTAKALNLHRNSLTYRLQRLRQLVDDDLEDADTRLQMMLSFRLAESPAEEETISRKKGQ